MSSIELKTDAPRVSLPFVSPEEFDFWKLVSVAKGDGCWEWKGSTGADGYGRWRGEGAHRVAYRLSHGSIPEGMYICHECDNPRCVRPSHLKAATQSANMLDKFARGRHTDHARKLRPSQVIEIRRLRAEGYTSAQIAPLYGISHGHARNCCNGNKWASLVGAEAVAI